MKRKMDPAFFVARIVMLIYVMICILPFVLMVLSSFTSESALVSNGYSFFPKEWSLAAYKYLWEQRLVIGRSYGITAVVTVVGTSVSLLITAMLSYCLSRQDLFGRKILSFYVLFTMLFNGGLVPTYMFYTRSLGIKNTIFAYILPNLLLTAFQVIVMRTYYAQSIPDAIIDASKIDGASELQCFFRVILPMSTPILATIGIMTAITYWNDFNNGLVYITDTKLYGIQNVLNKIIEDQKFLSTMAGQAGITNSGISLPSTASRMAIAVIGILPIICTYPFFQKYFIKGIALGSVKG